MPIKVVTDLNGNRHEIKIDEDLKWLAPYITRAKALGIPIWRVKEIKGYSVPDGKIERQSAATIKDGNKKVVITILKWHQVWSKKNGRFEVEEYHSADCDHNFEETLNTLAHELSHLVHWEHTADRLVLESRLMLSFSCLARRRGYKGYDS